MKNIKEIIKIKEEIKENQNDLVLTKNIQNSNIKGLAYILGPLFNF